MLKNKLTSLLLVYIVATTLCSIRADNSAHEKMLAQIEERLGAIETREANRRPAVWAFYSYQAVYVKVTENDREQIRKESTKLRTEQEKIEQEIEELENKILSEGEFLSPEEIRRVDDLVKDKKRFLSTSEQTIINKEREKASGLSARFESALSYSVEQLGIEEGYDVVIPIVSPENSGYRQVKIYYERKDSKNRFVLHKDITEELIDITTAYYQALTQ